MNRYHRHDKKRHFFNFFISKEAEFTVLDNFKHIRPKKVEANDFKKVKLSELNFVVATLLPQKSYAHSTFYFLQCSNS